MPNIDVTGRTRAGAQKPEVPQRDTSPRKQSDKSERRSSATKTPEVTVAAPEVTVAAPEVTVATPEVNVATPASVGSSPRRSSRARKATEKGKNIFEIFESKDRPIAPKEKATAKEKHAKKDNVPEEVEKEDEAVEKIVTPAKEETEEIGRHTRSRKKLATQKPEVTSKSSERETKDKEETKKSAEDVPREKSVATATPPVRETRSSRKSDAARGESGDGGGGDGDGDGGGGAVSCLPHIVTFDSARKLIA